MSTLTRLNGSKVLKGVAFLTLLCPPEQEEAPLHVCRAIAEAGINLPYVTLVRDGASWVISLAVEAQREAGVEALLRETGAGDMLRPGPDCVILSLFPHQSNPLIPAALFQAFERAGLAIQGMANSPSAVSLVIQESLLERASRALFEAFTFRTYASPEEWKEAQAGKEALYKEVVASYQEKRPKVYGITCMSGQRLASGLLADPSLSPLTPVMNEAARRGMRLSHIASVPSGSPGLERVCYALPAEGPNPDPTPMPSPFPGTDAPEPVLSAVFAMNGPHFGDRYGITSELLAAFHAEGIPLLAMNCTVASITGVVPAADLDRALTAIQGCFEVPSVLRT